jgi:hypothetical protein
MSRIPFLSFRAKSRKSPLLALIVSDTDLRYDRHMSAAELIAEIKALAPEERERVLEFLASDQELREDLQDSLLLEARSDEPSRPLEDVLRDLNL